MKKLITVFLFLLISFIGYDSMGQMIPKDLYTRALTSQFIFEGSVIRSNSYYTHDSMKIFTSSTLKILKIFKGNLVCGTVEVISLGGKVGNEAMFLSHNLELIPGMTGIFLCDSTTEREFPTTDYYPETNSVKLFALYNEQSYIKYFNDKINHLIVDYQYQLDSLAEVYGMLELYNQLNYIDCADHHHEKIFSEEKINEPVFAPKNKSLLAKQFPHSENVTALQLLDSLQANKIKYGKPNTHSRVSTTLTYKMSNPIITGSTQKYAEFDVSISDNQGTGYLDQSQTRIKYNTAVFGSNIFASNGVEITAGTLNADTIGYYPPYAIDLSSDAILVAANEQVYSQNKVLVPTTPQTIFHIKMKILDCSVASNIFIEDTSISGFGPIMLAFSAYADFPNDTFQTYYDNIVANENKPLPDCNTTINSIYPLTVNGGVGDTVTVSGITFGTAKGNIYLRNADDGGLTYAAIDTIDITLWSDTLIQFIMPSKIDTGETPGTGYLKLKTSTGDTTTFLTSKLTVFYSVYNYIEPGSSNQQHKYMNTPVDYLYTDGYIFRTDTSFSNHADRMACLKKAVHDWVCLTNINFQIGTDSIMPIPSGYNDGVNLISVGHLDINAYLAQTTQHLHFEPTCSGDGIEMVKGIDLIVNENYINQMVFDTVSGNNITTGFYDLFEILIHELGHGSSMGHVINPTNVMWWQSSTGQTSANRRIRLYQDFPANYGGNYVVTQSQNAAIASCGVQIMPLLYETNCATNQNAIQLIGNNESGLIVYPNPTSGDITISYDLNSHSNISISVFDILGREIYRNEFGKLAEGKHEINLDFNSFSSGLYMIRLSENEKYCYQKLIKE